MPRNGAYLVRDLPQGLTLIVCRKCGRHGRYRRETFIDRCGPDMALPDALRIMAACELRGNMSDPCGAQFEGLPWA